MPFGSLTLLHRELKMKTKICFFPEYAIKDLDVTTEQEQIGACKKILDNGLEPKFVLNVMIDFVSEEMFLCVSVSPSTKHQNIADMIHRVFKQKNLYIVDTPSLGGGCLKLEKGELHFFSSSYDLGPYSEYLLRKAEVDIKKKFNVDIIHYSTDRSAPRQWL